MAGVPVTQVTTVEVFPAFAQAPVVVTPAARFDASPWRFAALFIAGMAALWLTQRFVPLARGFVVFLTVLLLATAGAVILDPSSQFGSVEFSQIWLRGELLVWLLLPVFSAGVFTLIQRTWVVGVIWALVVQGFGFFWSIARLAFCLGVMHYSGVLFIPMLWFSVGLLADMVYLMVFYSLAVHWSVSRYWGRGVQ